MQRLLYFFLILTLVYAPVELVQAQTFAIAPRISLDYMGNWSVSTSYESGDAVRSPSNGYLYVATASVTGGADPGSTAVPATPWSFGITSPIDRGPRGSSGIDGNSTRAVFYDSINQPSPTGATYDGTTFTPPTGSSAVIPDPLVSNLWMQLHELRNDTSPARLDNLGLTQLNGPRGPPGNDGNDGTDGAIGPQGIQGTTGNDGTNGTNGYSSQIIFRKTFAIELLNAPTVTYDGTSLTLPPTENNAWQLTPYSSRIQGSFELHADNTSPKDIDVDTGVQPNVVYVLDDAGQFVYRYQETGAYIDRWALDPTNDTAEALDVQGNLVRILDTMDRGPALNQYNQIFVYSKSDGGRQTGIEFRVPRAGSPIAKGITTEGDSIYILTETSIRRFDITSRMEQTTGVLSSLRSSQSIQMTILIQKVQMLTLITSLL